MNELTPEQVRDKILKERGGTTAKEREDAEMLRKMNAAREIENRRIDSE